MNIALGARRARPAEKAEAFAGRHFLNAPPRIAPLARAGRWHKKMRPAGGRGGVDVAERKKIRRRAKRTSGSSRQLLLPRLAGAI